LQIIKYALVLEQGPVTFVKYVRLPVQRRLHPLPQARFQPELIYQDSGNARGFQARQNIR
jgi:hypothetical protein